MKQRKHKKNDKNSSASKNLLSKALDHHRAGRFWESEAAYQEILKSDPANSNVLHMLGVLRCQQGDSPSGIRLIEKAIELNPDVAAFHCNLGNALNTLGNHKEAMLASTRAISLNPDYAEAHHILGICQTGLGRIQDAAASYKRAIEINPGFAGAHNNLGLRLIDINDLKSAMESFNQAIVLDPDYAKAYSNMGNLYSSMGNSTKAMKCHRQAIRINPDNADFYSNLAGVYKDQGRIDEALMTYEKALDMDQAHAISHSNLLLCLHYKEQSDPAKILEHHKEWGMRHAISCIQKDLNHTNDPDPDRRLKIGYVSPDFRTHSVAYFIESILAHHDRKAFEIYCYATSPRCDATTNRLRGLADRWQDIHYLSSQKMAENIRRDNIDILVDLAGHTGTNQMQLFAYKPAPIQVTYIGYPDTTGLPAMDYRISDSFADPPGITDHLATEQLIRLPGSFLCYTPAPNTPQVSHLPAVQGAHVTFGSFNHRAKITPNVVTIWCEILRRLPSAHIIIKATSLTDIAVREDLMKSFSGLGIPEERIHLYGYLRSREEHLALYNQIDIALDTFPYNGTTTTCEALWMGVPVITLKGDIHVSRVGTSILTNAGLTDLIAESAEGYVQKAADLAKDIERLKALRLNLRSTLINSLLMDAKTFTHNLEDEYRRIWYNWCRVKQNEIKEGCMIKDEHKSIDNPGQKLNQFPSGQALVLVQKGEELYNEGLFEDAQDAFRKALEIDPENVSAVNNLGVLNWHKGNTGKAIERFQQTLAIDPDNEDATHNLQQIYKTRQSAIEQHTESTDGPNQNTVLNSLEPNAPLHSDEKPRKLHIGGKQPHPEWEIFDAVAESYVDHLGNAKDLSRFDDDTFDAIYASHVLEHFDYNEELYSVLKEWHKKLKPGGKIYISVPDLDKLTALFLKKDTYNLKDRFLLTRMILGGHMDEYDYHKTAFNSEILSVFLNEAGFCNLKTVDSFGIFSDTSTTEFHGNPISINIIAEKSPCIL